MTMLEKVEERSAHTGEAIPFDDMIATAGKSQELLESEAATLRKTLESYVKSGYIQEGTEAYYEMLDAVHKAEEEAAEAAEKVAKIYKDAFDDIEKRFGDQIGMLDNMLDTYEMMATASDYTGAAKPFDEKRATLQEKSAKAAAEAAALEAQLKTAMEKGEYAVGSSDWYEMQDAIHQARQEAAQAAIDIAESYKEAFDDTAARYDQLLGEIENRSAQLQRKLDKIEALGYLGGSAVYQAQIALEEKHMDALLNKRADLERDLADAIEGGIAIGSPKWYEMQSQIDDVTASIEESEIALIKYQKALRQLDWDQFDFIQDRISQVTAESEFLIKLMEKSDLFDKKGNITERGTASIGLHAMNYDVYMRQADDYADELARINKELLEDPADTELIKRREELLKLQRDSILSAEEEKEAIRDLVEDGIKKQLDALKELIDKYNDSLSSAKDLYSYQKNIEKQTKQIASLQKQITAYSGDTSEENRARLQKLTVDLREANEQLAETQYDQYISDTKRILDDLYDEIEKTLNSRLDDTDALFRQMVDTTNTKAGEIKTTLETESGKVGSSLTDIMGKIWSAEDGKNVVSTYADSTSTVINGAANSTTASITELGNKLKTDMDAAAASAAGEIPSVEGIETKVKAIDGNVGEIASTLGEMKRHLEAMEKALEPKEETPGTPQQTIEDKLDELKTLLTTGGGVSPIAGKEGTGQSLEKTAPTEAIDTTPDQPYVTVTAKTVELYKKTKKGFEAVKESVRKNDTFDYVQTVSDSSNNQYAEIKYNGKTMYVPLGAVKITTPTLYKNSARGFAKGGFIADMQKVAYKNGDEMVTFNTLKPGEAILTTKEAAQFRALIDNLPGLQGAMDVAQNLKALNNNAGVSGGDVNVGGITVQIPIEHVQDYNDFVRQLRDDKTFERMIKSITVDPLTGGSSLAKKKYYN